MKKLLFMAAAAMLLSTAAHADGNDRALKFLNPTDLTTLGVTSLDNSADYIYVYDASADNVLKVLAPEILETTSSLAELNILDGVTATATELNYNDITTLGTGAASKAVVLDASGDYAFPAAATISYASGGSLTLDAGTTFDVAGTFEVGNVAVTATAAELNYNDIATLGTGAASKAVVMDASGDFLFPAAATIKFASGGTLQVNSTDGAVLSAIRTATDTDLDSGQTSEVVTVTGATASSLCFASITNDTTTEVSVTNVVAATDQVTVQVSADPSTSGADLAVVCFN